MKHLTFREEAHAIEAAIAGKGLAMCSDVLVAREFADGRLVRFSTLSLPGYGFFVVSLPDLIAESLLSRNGLQGPRRETCLNIGISVSVYSAGDRFQRVANAFSAAASWFDSLGMCLECFADPKQVVSSAAHGHRMVGLHLPEPLQLACVQRLCSGPMICSRLGGDSH